MSESRMIDINWLPIAEIPDDRMDGRPVLIRHGDRGGEHVARWDADRWAGGRGAWVTGDATLLDVTAWADVRAGDDRRASR